MIDEVDRMIDFDLQVKERIGRTGSVKYQSVRVKRSSNRRWSVLGVQLTFI